MDHNTGVVKIPAKVVVEEYIKYFVPTYKFTAQDPAFDREIPKDRPLVVTGSSAPNIVDPKTGEEKDLPPPPILPISRI